MNFSEQPPSKQWATLTYKGVTFAEVWFKPEGQPFALTFRIPHASFQNTDLSSILTTENLLKAVGIAAEEVDSWSHEGGSYSGINGMNPELRQPLSPGHSDVTHLNINATLKPPAQVVASPENSESVAPSEKWQNLQTRWNFVLGLEVTIDTLRLRMESLRAEMEAALNKTLAGDEKLHAPNADVAQWNKAKSRGRYALPKAKEFIHRATWAMGAPERKKLEELFKNNRGPQVQLPQIDQVQEEVENLLKDRQILSSQGVTVYQECKNCTSDIQGALRTLQSNANKKRVANRAKGKTF